MSSELPAQASAASNALKAFALTGRVGFELQANGFTKINLWHPCGSSASLYTHGAHLTSFVTQGKEVLYLSRKAIFDKGTALRGGIPICWPQFSGRGKLPAHGLVRAAEWQVVASGISASGQSVITLGLSDTEQSRALWPHTFKLEYQIALDKNLQISLRVKNTDATAFSYTGALHSYFQIGSIEATQVEGLAGLNVIDFLLDNAQSKELRAQVAVHEHNDRCYLQAPSQLKIIDAQNQRSIQLTSEHFADAVLWNPWSERSKQIKDLGAEDYRTFLCLEHAVLEKPVVLTPGKEAVHSVKIEVLAG